LKRLSVGIAVMVSIVALLAGGTMSGTALKVRRPPETQEYKDLLGARLAKWLSAPVKDMPSERRIVRWEPAFPGALSAAAQPDTLRICALRVEFGSVPNPDGISGNGGRFDLSDGRDEILIDPPPHDRKYFSKHMEALSLYYDAMSYGKLVIDWEVFPLENDSAYELPDVGDYNPGGGVWTWELDGLELFFRDAITVADQDPALDFRDFDAVVLFHAGSDWQNDIRGDSPYDLPSFFISLAGSVAVEDSSHFIVDGCVVPETTTQDGYFNGINGVLAHEVGHQLGLPDLYDTYSGLSIVGYWDLMDYGSGIGVVLQDTLTQEAYFVTGVVPGSLSAWSKAYLGWTVPDTADFGGDFALEATELQNGYPNREAVMVPLNSNEYYLIENRQTDLDGDGLGYLLTDPSEDSTGVILGPVNNDKEFNYEYDFALPGDGLLIWHVDRVWVSFLNPYDLVNAFPERRGITLKEADGIPDLGNLNSAYFLGGPEDPFRLELGSRFADDTFPDTHTRTGCHSHVAIDDISESGNLMTFSVSHEWGRRGFPTTLGDSLRFGVPSLLVTDTDNDGRDEIQAALNRAYWDDSLGVAWLRPEIYGYELGAGGEPVPVGVWPRRLHGSHPTEISAIDFNGDGMIESAVADETGRLYAFRYDGHSFFIVADSLGAFAQVDGSINGVPVSANLDGAGGSDLLAGTENEGIVKYSYPGPTKETLGSGRNLSQPVVLEGTAASRIFTYARGMILIYSYPHEELGTSPDETAVLQEEIEFPCSADPADVYLALADLDRLAGDEPEIIVVTREGWVWALDQDGSVLPGWGVKCCGPVVAPPAFADLNGDGWLELILTDENHRIWVVFKSGSTVEGWPRTWYGCSLPVWSEDYYPMDTTIPVPSPIVADLDFDENLNLIQGSLFECITGWEPGGTRMDGFPLSMGGGCSAVAMGDLDGDDRLELVSGGGDGNLYAFLHPAAGVLVDERSAPWRTAYANPSRNAVYPIELMPEPGQAGTRLLVRGSFHAFPNPAGAAYNESGLNEISFSFDTDTGGRATIEMFDVTGIMVKAIEIDASGQSPRVTVPNVDISPLGSGLYLCRLHLEDGGESIDEFFKLAVKR
jgi:M6 family metalloprotease-like protein